MTYCDLNCVDMEQARSVSERTSSCHGCGGGAISVKIFPFGQYVTLADGLLDDGQVNAILAIICWSETRTWIASYLSLACRIWFVWPKRWVFLKPIMINTVVENMHTQVARTKSPTPVGGPKSRGIKEGLKGGLKRQIVDGTVLTWNLLYSLSLIRLNF